MTCRPIVYGTYVSLPVRAVLLTLKALNVNYELRIVNLQAGENLTDDYLRKNPTSGIPALEDEGRFIGDSHAIMAYLVGKYGKTDHLYPKELYARAKIDQVLHFDSSVLFVECVYQVLSPIFKRQTKTVTAAKLDTMKKAFGVLERFFGEHNFLAGPLMTIADLSCICSVTAMALFVPVEAEQFPKLAKWYIYMQTLPYFAEIMDNEKTMATVNFIKKTAQLSKL